MQKINKNFFIFIAFLFIVLAPVFSTNAAGLVPCGSGSESSDACTICDLALGVSNIIDALMGWVSIAAVVVIVVAGIMYIVSAGNPGMITTAKTAIKNTLIGVAIVLSAFVLIHYTLKAIAQNDVPTTGPLSGAGGSSWSFNCN